MPAGAVEHRTAAMHRSDPCIASDGAYVADDEDCY
jgi:hypothetical protein